MAVDTAVKRRRAHRVASGGWSRGLPAPDGSIEAVDRAHLLGYYAPSTAAPATGLQIAAGDILGSTGKANTLAATGKVNILGKV